MTLRRVRSCRGRFGRYLGHTARPSVASPSGRGGTTWLVLVPRAGLSPSAAAARLNPGRSNLATVAVRNVAAVGGCIKAPGGASVGTKRRLGGSAMVWGLVMHVRLLGPVEIETAVGTVGLGGPRAQAVVGLLAVRAGEMLNALHRGRPLGADIVVHRRCRTPGRAWPAVGEESVVLRDRPGRRTADRLRPGTAATGSANDRACRLRDRSRKRAHRRRAHRPECYVPGSRGCSVGGIGRPSPTRKPCR
jgi:hypothetical protein